MSNRSELLSIGYVYALVDPRFTGHTSKHVRYIGRTNKPSKRLKVHLKVKDKSHRTNWIKHLAAVQQVPRMEIVAEYRDILRSDLLVEEVMWIAVFRSYGFDLTNMTSGGDGYTGWTQQQKDVQRVKARELAIKLHADPEYRVKQKVGLKLACGTPEYRAAKSLFFKEIRSRPDVLEKISGKNHWLHKAGVDLSFRLKTRRPVLCIETGVVYSHIKDALDWLISIGVSANPSKGNIHMCAAGKRTIAYGYTWRFLDERS